MGPGFDSQSRNFVQIEKCFGLPDKTLHFVVVPLFQHTFREKPYIFRRVNLVQIFSVDLDRMF
jgi:hypothetical protein